MMNDHVLIVNTIKILSAVRSQQCYGVSSLPPSNARKIHHFEKTVFCRSDLEHPKTARKTPGNAPEQRTYSTYNISKAQLQPTMEKKVREILHCYFYDDTHGTRLRLLVISYS